MTQSSGENREYYELKGPRSPELVGEKVTVERNGQVFQQTVYKNRGKDTGAGEPKHPQGDVSGDKNSNGSDGQSIQRTPSNPEFIQGLQGSLTNYSKYGNLKALGSHKAELQEMKNKAQKGELLFSRPKNRIPALDITQATHNDVQKAASKLVNSLLDKLEKQPGSFFRETLDNTFKKSLVLSKSDREWVNGIIGQNKYGRQSTASDQLTLLSDEVKRLENKMQVKPSRQTLSNLHKLGVVQKEMRGSVADAIYDNLNFNKKEKNSLKASLPKGVSKETLALAKDAAGRMKNLVPQSLLDSNLLKIKQGQGSNTKYNHKDKSISVHPKTKTSSLLREYGNQLEASNPSLRRLMVEHYVSRTAGKENISLNKIDPRYSKDEMGRLGSLKHPGLAALPTNTEGYTGKVGFVMQSLQSKDAFRGLYKTDPEVVNTVLGAFYGARPTTPKTTATSGLHSEKAQKLQGMFDRKTQKIEENETLPSFDELSKTRRSGVEKPRIEASTKSDKLRDKVVKNKTSADKVKPSKTQRKSSVDPKEQERLSNIQKEAGRLAREAVQKYKRSSQK